MPRLPRSFAWAILSVAGGVLAAATWSHLRPLVGSAPAEPSPTSAGAVPAGLAQIAAGGSQAGNPLVEEVLSVMERRPNAVAKVRQRVRIGSHELLGVGQYWQQGVGNQRRSRWQLQTHVAGQTASLVQVYDSRFVWTDRNLPESRRVSRIDMVRLRRELNSSPGFAEEGRGGESSQRVLAGIRGGISQLLVELLDRFDFSAPEAVRRDEGDSWVIVGHWEPAELARLWPGLTVGDASLASWPPSLPHHVVLEVGQEDLFPVRLEYRRADDAALAKAPAGGGTARDPLARYEWFDLQLLASMDPRHFTYTAGEIDWVDETSAAVAKALERVAIP